MIFGHNSEERKLKEELKELGERLKRGEKKSDDNDDYDMGRQEVDKRWLHREGRWDIKKKVFLGKMNMLGKTGKTRVSRLTQKGGGRWQRNYLSTT